MTALGALDIERLTADMLDDVVRIHRAGMGYTLNAQLGEDHLRYLYTAMTADPSCYAGVARVGGSVAGAVSGSVDAEAFSARVVRAMPARRLCQIAMRMLLRPRLIWYWIQGSAIARPVHWDAGEVRAVLTAIVVDSGIQGRGIGRSLVAAFEDFLRNAGVRSYRLDTQVANRRAAQFYRDLGFVEVTRRAGSIVFVRDLPA